MLKPPQRSLAQFLATPEEYRGGISLTTYVTEVLGSTMRTAKAWQATDEFARALQEMELAQRQANDYEGWCMRQRIKYQLWANLEGLQKRSNKNKEVHDQIRQYSKQLLDITDGAEIVKETVRFPELDRFELLELMLRKNLNPGIDRDTLEKAKVAKSCAKQSLSSQEPPSPSEEPTSAGGPAIEQVLPAGSPLLDLPPSPVPAGGRSRP